MPMIGKGASGQVRSHDVRWQSAAESFRRFVPEADPERVSRALARDLGALGSFAFEVVGEMWDRPLLSRRDRSLIVIAALAAQSRDEELELHTQVGLRHGLTRDEIEEILPHVAAYAGFPAAMAAAREIDKGLRQAEGVERLSRREGAARKSDEARDRDAKRVSDALGLAATDAAHGHLSEVYKRWVLGEIWSREALSQRARALVTLSVVIAQGETGFLPKVAAMALAAGLSTQQIEEQVTHLGLYVGIPRAVAAWDAIRAALQAGSA